MEEANNERLERLKSVSEGMFGESADEKETGALIETAFLMAAADGELSNIEFDQLVATIEYVAGAQYTQDQLRTMINQLVDTLGSDGWEKRIAAVKADLTNTTARRNAYRLAAGVSFIDGEVQENEARLFGILAEAFEIANDEASALLTEVRDELFGRPDEDTNPKGEKAAEG